MLSKIKKRKDEERAKNSAPSVDVAEERIKKDLEVGMPVKADVVRNEKHRREVFITIRPDTGIWAGGTFMFILRCGPNYPQEAPKVRYTGPLRVFHPNIEGDDDKEEWGVCLGFLEQWRPEFTIGEIVFALSQLFECPTYDDPLPGVAKTAAALLKEKPQMFERVAQQWMSGNYTLDI